MERIKKYINSAEYDFIRLGKRVTHKAQKKIVTKKRG